MDKIGRYQLVAELAREPLGDLCAGRSAGGGDQGRLVAVRRTPRSGMSEEEAHRLGEAIFAAMEVRHPKIAAVLDLVMERAEVAVVSEYVEGETLRSLMAEVAAQRGGVPASVALRVVIDVAEALRAARDLWAEIIDPHDEEQRLVRLHGGLTPASVWVASFGDTMLGDLGLAGTVAGFTELGRHPALLAYRAPEQLRAATPDERSDIFSLGVILWELLAGRSLFGAGSALLAPHSPADLAVWEKMVLETPVPRLDTLSDTRMPVPAAVASIVVKALHFDLSARFSTLEALIGAIESLGSAAVATPEQVVVAFQPFWRKRLDVRRVSLDGTPVSAKPETTPPDTSRPTPVPTRQTRPEWAVEGLPARPLPGTGPEAAPAPGKAPEPPAKLPVPRAKPSLPRPRASSPDLLAGSRPPIPSPLGRAPAALGAPAKLAPPAGSKTSGAAPGAFKLDFSGAPRPAGGDAAEPPPSSGKEVFERATAEQIDVSALQLSKADEASGTGPLAPSPPGKKGRGLDIPAPPAALVAAAKESWPPPPPAGSPEALAFPSVSESGAPTLPPVSPVAITAPAPPRTGASVATPAAVASAPASSGGGKKGLVIGVVVAVLLAAAAAAVVLGRGARSSESAAPPAAASPPVVPAPVAPKPAPEPPTAPPPEPSEPVAAAGKDAGVGAQAAGSEAQGAGAAGEHAPAEPSTAGSASSSASSSSKTPAKSTVKPRSFKPAGI